MFRIIDFPQNENSYDSVEVFVNGVKIKPLECTVSAIPFNVGWPGQQRNYNQTELAGVISILANERLDFVIKHEDLPYKTIIRPLSANVDCQTKDGITYFSIDKVGFYSIEIGNEHNCIHLFVDKPKDFSIYGEPDYYFSKGIHEVGKLVLKSGDKVFIDEGALVKGVIYADNVENVKIYGYGRLDGGFEERKNARCYESDTNGCLKFYNSSKITIDGVLLTDSAVWVVNLFNCTDVEIKGVKIVGHWKYNTDGIDIVNSRDVTVRRSFIHSFDDTVTIKGIDRFAHSDNKNILIEGCTLWCDWGKTCELGIETACSEYKDITFRDCDILRAGNTALDIQNGDLAEVHDVTFENIRVEYNAFDTPEVYQATDDTEYTREDEHAYPYLISIKNHRWRTKENEIIWGVPMEYKTDADFSGVQNACVHDVTARDITVYYDEYLPLEDGKFKIPTVAYSFVEGVKFYNLKAEDVRVIYKGKEYPLDIKL